MITRQRSEALPISAAIVNDVITEHDLGYDRLLGLYEYFGGEHAITSRTRTTGLPNNMLVHAFPQYIATMTSGYLIGDPVQYQDDDQEAALEPLLKAYKAADTQSIDAEIALYAAIFGRGCELCYANMEAQPRTAALDPINAFVVYDDTVEHKPLFAVHRLTYTDSAGTVRTRKVTAYTDTEVIEFSASDASVGGTGEAYTSAPKGIAASVVAQNRHNFGGVPLVEYWNNSIETGDYEGVTTLIDAYDTLQSDRVNDKEQFANALLVLTGVVGFDAPVSGDTRTPAQRLKEEGTLSLPDVGAKAEYLTKVLNEGDTDVLRVSIKQDIHKFSMVPDLTDENFAGNSSGVAMKYKLLGLEQITKIKERWFREGLRWRLRLFANFLRMKGSPALDADRVQMQFRRSLPVNDAEVAQTVATLKNIVPDSLLLAQIPFIEDVRAAMDELADQRKEAAKAQAEAFGAYPNANEEEDEEESAEA